MEKMVRFVERFSISVQPRDNKNLQKLAKKNKISKAIVVRRMIEYALSNPGVMAELFKKI
jgi:predicted DNA-binding protein